MQPVTHTQSRLYSPTSAPAQHAVNEFLDRHAEWERGYKAAQGALRDFVRSNFTAKALGFVATDPLNMSSFGVVFEGHPGAGWIAVPAQVADRVAAHGLRGEAFFPDMATPLGRTAMSKLSAVSRAAERRPLCNDVPGVRAAVISSGSLVLTRAMRTEAGVAIVAAPAAVGPAAQVTAFISPTHRAPAAVTADTPRRSTTPRMRM